MIRFETLPLADLDEAEINHWIEESWVHAQGQNGAWAFEAVDVARVKLIHTLRTEMEINDLAMPVVLSLLDQLYAFRRHAARLNAALAGLPPPALAEILQKLETGE